MFSPEDYPTVHRLPDSGDADPVFAIRKYNSNQPGLKDFHHMQYRHRIEDTLEEPTKTSTKGPNDAMEPWVEPELPVDEEVLLDAEAKEELQLVKKELHQASDLRLVHKKAVKKAAVASGEESDEYVSAAESQC